MTLSISNLSGCHGTFLYEYLLMLLGTQALADVRFCDYFSLFEEKY